MAIYFSAAAAAVVFFVLKARKAYREMMAQDYQERLVEAMIPTPQRAATPGRRKTTKGQ